MRRRGRLAAQTLRFSSCACLWLIHTYSNLPCIAPYTAYIYGHNVSYYIIAELHSSTLVEYCCMKMTNIISRFHLVLYTIGTCLDRIYVMAFTSSLRFSDSTHPHNIEVVAVGQTRKILMPDRPGNYELHRGDIWKMSISGDLGFLPGTCLRYV